METAKTAVRLRRAMMDKRWTCLFPEIPRSSGFPSFALEVHEW